MTTTTEAPIVRGAGVRLSTTRPLESDDGDDAITVLMDEGESRRYVALMRSDLDRADESISSFRQRAWEWKEREGWRALGYRGFIEGIQGEFGAQWSKSYLSRLVKAAEIERALELPMGNDVPERQLRPLGDLDSPDDQRAAWERSGELAGDGKRTAALVQQAVAEIKPPAPAGWPCAKCGTLQTGMRKPPSEICTACARALVAPTADDVIPHLPPDFAAAQRRAEKIGLTLSMNMHGRFDLRDEVNGAGLVGFRDWSDALGQLARMEAATAARDAAPAPAPAQQRQFVTDPLDPIRTSLARATRWLAQLAGELESLADDPNVATEDYDRLSHAIGDARRALEIADSR